MARVGGGGGPRWVWPLIILLLLAGLALLAWAFMAPPASEPQSSDATPTPAAAPAEKSSAVSIKDITDDPSAYYGDSVTVEGRITRLVGDQGLYLTDRDGDGELLAVLDRRVADTDLQSEDVGRFTGTVREVTGEELDRLEDSVDQPTRDALAQEKAYLSVEDFEEVTRQ